MPASRPQYRGRFAPSPTGPLHLGSLIAALASFLDARHCGGVWLVRMEDLDPPREEPGAAARILQSLQRHGLYWDEAVMYQSARGNAYSAALSALSQLGALFACDCTRAMLDTDGVCRGNCRARQEELTDSGAIRAWVTANAAVTFTDLLQGSQASALPSDFVVRRRDQLTAYQLAVVVDDAAQGITHVVRGSDLLDSTPRQIYLQRSLGYITPLYCHLPVITTTQGQKLSKQNHAPALVDENAVTNLRYALRFLGQHPPANTLTQTVDVLAHAIEHWELAHVPAAMSRPATSIGLDP